VSGELALQIVNPGGEEAEFLLFDLN